MSKSQRLSFSEVRDALRLVGEVCELGGDPFAWRHHMAASLVRMTDAHTAFHEEEHVAAHPRDSGVLGLVLIGFDSAAAMAGMAEYVRVGGFHAHPLFPIIQPIATRPWTRTRRELIPDDRAWYGTRMVSEIQRAGDSDDMIHSRQPIPRPGWANMLGLHRRFGQRPFSTRERRLVHLVHEELGRLWQRAAPADDPADALPPRLRQIVLAFRAGDGEKQIAHRLGLSRQTIHAYAKDLHRRYEVSSRIELLNRLQPQRRSLRPRLCYEAVNGTPTPGA